jgi:predicted negative regulator of RcsB-dependent stress response
MGFSFAIQMLLRIGPYIGMAALAGWIYWQGYDSAQRKAALNDAKQTIEVLQENTRRNSAAAYTAQQAAQARAKTAKELSLKVDAYEDELKARGNSGCILDDADVGRLQQLK